MLLRAPVPFRSHFDNAPLVWSGTGSYADASGDLLTGASIDLSSVGIAVYTGADGLEEMHCFLGLGWFDTGSWAWGHYIAEWGTKGVFQVTATAGSTHKDYGKVQMDKEAKQAWTRSLSLSLSQPLAVSGMSMVGLK